MTPDQEFRAILRDELKEIRGDVKKIKEEMTTLKVKVALFSSLIGSVATLIVKKLIGA